MSVPLPLTALGRSGIEVSRLALGSWRTYERIGRDQGLAVMKAAREAGINFLDDARYNDETGRGPPAHRILRGGLRRAVPRRGLARCSIRR